VIAPNPSIYKKLTSLLIIAFLTFTFALGGTALVLINNAPVAGNPFDGGAVPRSQLTTFTHYRPYAIHTQPLFNASGVNNAVAHALVNTLNRNFPGGVDGLWNGSSTVANAGHFSLAARRALYGDNTTDSTANPGAIFVRLFEPIGAGTPITGGGGVNSPSDLSSFTTRGGIARWWQVTHVHNGMMTLMMVEPYRASIFNHVTNPSTDYGTSILRNNLMTDFTGGTTGAVTGGVLGRFPQSVRNLIVPGSTTTNAAFVGGFSLWGNNVAATDLIWQVSAGEILSGSATTGWNLPVWSSQFQDSFQSNIGGVVTGRVWTGSQVTGTGVNQPNSLGIFTGAGSFEWFPLSFVHGIESSNPFMGVRPALRINLTELINLSEPPVPQLPAPANLRIIPSDHSGITWDAVTGVSGYAIYMNNERVATTGQWLTSWAPGNLELPATGSATFAVRALHANTARVSNLSSTVSVTFSTLARPTPRISGTTVSWDSVTGATRYHVMIREIPWREGGFSHDVWNVTGTTFDISSIIPDRIRVSINVQAATQAFYTHNSEWSSTGGGWIFYPSLASIFETPVDVTQGDNILMNTLFPTQTDYRAEIRVGDWVKSNSTGNTVFRQVDNIGSGANPTVTLGLTIQDIFDPAEGLAELIAYVHGLGLVSTDFDNDADWNTFTRALFYAENAIHNVGNLSASELEDITQALRDALDLRN